MSHLNLDLRRREYETLGTDQNKQEESIGATAYIAWPFSQFVWDLSLPPKQVLSSKLFKSRLSSTKCSYIVLHPEIVGKTFELPMNAFVMPRSRVRDAIIVLRFKALIFAFFAAMPNIHEFIFYSFIIIVVKKNILKSTVILSSGACQGFGTFMLNNSHRFLSGGMVYDSVISVFIPLWIKKHLKGNQDTFWQFLHDYIWEVVGSKDWTNIAF